MSSHLNKGNTNNQIAFVLSTPGQAEKELPASGETGENMNGILIYLNALDAQKFPVTDRYHYLITNACTHTMFQTKDNATECKDNEIIQIININRIEKELENHTIIVLCGNKAHLLESCLINKTVIKVSHLGNKGLRNKYPNNSKELAGLKIGQDRETKRQELVAKDIYEQLQKQFNGLSL